jgi:serine/threonine-protein kinase
VGDNAQKEPGLSADELQELLAKTDYRPIRRLGGGRTGDVYLVEQQFLGRQFVLKVLRSHLVRDPQFADRLRIEAQAAARLRHPNVVEMVDLWTSPLGHPCVVMELLEGRSLGQELAARDRLGPEEAVNLTKQALSGLAAAHALGIVHRDVTPENLFLHDAPGFPRSLKILDFGLARVLPTAPFRAPEPLKVPTKTGAVLGSPRFMSPEAARGERVDHRADLYSLGVVLYVMLTGQGPHDAPVARIAPPSQLVKADFDRQLDAIALRAIADSVEERYQTAQEFTDDLNRIRPVTRRPSARG